MTQHTARRRGFTLVELLVVIGIIAILISILIPALSKAQRQSNQVYCQSQLRQLANALIMYTQASKGTFPYGSAVSNDDSERYWFTLIQKYLGRVAKFGNTSVARVMICPEDPYQGGVDAIKPGMITNATDVAVFSSFPRSYGLNRKTANSARTLCFKVFDVKKSSEFLVIGEHRPWLQWPARSDHSHLHHALLKDKWGDYHELSRGKRVLNVAYLDGHVEARTKQQLDDGGQHRKEWFRTNIVDGDPQD